MKASKAKVSHVERMRYCPDCRKPLEVGGEIDRKWRCAKCGFERAVEELLRDDKEKLTEQTEMTSTDLSASSTSAAEGNGSSESDDNTADSVEHAREIRLDAADSHDARPAHSDETLQNDFLVDELRLQPLTTQATVKRDSIAQVGLGSIEELVESGDVQDPKILPATTRLATGLEVSNESRQERAKENYNVSGGVYPVERHYPTLEAMQRLYRLFSYAAVLIVFPYLLARLAHVIWTTQEGLLVEIGAYLEFAVPVIFGTVAFVGTLFALSEGIRLAIDIQENTLRLANRQGRRRP